LEGGHNGSRSGEWFRTCYQFIFEKFALDFGRFGRPANFNPEETRAHFASLERMMANIRGHALEDDADARPPLVIRLRAHTDDEVLDDPYAP
jgi:hypothetical protein